MNTTELERMVVRLLGDGTSYQRMIETAQVSTAKAAGLIQFHSRKIETLAGSLRVYGSSARSTIAGLAALTGVVGIGGTAFEAVKRSASAEQTNIAFEALIGNAEKAKATIADLTQFAADTPFELPEILGAAKQMIGFGEEAENIVGTMRTLGDVSSALEIPLSSLTYLFGTLKSQQIAHTIDIQQFATRGIPIWKQLELQLKMTNAQVHKYIEAGKLSFTEVEKAFKATEGPMARFRGMMEKQSKSLNGLWSTLKDNVGITLTFIGDEIVKTFHFKDSLKSIIEFTNAVRLWVPGAAKLASDALTTLRRTAMKVYEGTVEQAVKFYEANKEIVRTAVAVAAAIAGIIVVVKALGVAIGIIGFVLAVLKVQQLAGIALWLLWVGALASVKVAFLALNAVFAVYNGMVAVLTFLFGTAAAAVGLYTGGTLGATAATWLLNMAIAVLSAETVVPLLIALISLAATLTVIAVAFKVVVAVVETLVGAGAAAVSAIGDIKDALGGFEQYESTLNNITGIFNDWYGAIGQIIEYAKTDMPAAWQYAKLTFDLMIAQINQRLPSMWEFFQEIAASAIKYVGAVLRNEFTAAFAVFREEWATTLSILQFGFDALAVESIPGVGSAIEGSMLVPLLSTALLLKDILSAQGKADEAAKLEEGIDGAVKTAKTKIDEIMADRDAANEKAKGVMKDEIAAEIKKLEKAQKAGDDEGVKAAKKAMKDFRMRQAEFEWAEWGKEAKDLAVPQAKNLGDEMGNAVAKGALKEVHRFDAALFRSAEAATRLAEYHAALNGDGKKGKGVPSGRNPVTGAVVARQQNPGVEAGGFAKNGQDMKEKYLGQIANNTKVIADNSKNAVMLAPANLNG